MKNLTIAFLFSVFFTSAQEIVFDHSSWADLKARAKKEQKLIFVDAFTTWCGPCKLMANTVFKDSLVAAYYNSQFVNAKIDMEKGEGVDIARQYSISCYPSLLFINGDGELIHRSAGYKENSAFIEDGKNAFIPERTFSQVQKKYESGQSDPPFVLDYLNMLSSACLGANVPATRYLSSLKEEEYLERGNWRIIQQFVDDIHSPAFVYLVKNRAAFAKKFGKDTVNNKIYYTYLNRGFEFYSQQDHGKAELTALKKEITDLKLENGDELKLLLDQVYYQSAEEWDNYFTSSAQLIKKYKGGDYDFLNNVSYTVFEKCKKKEQLQLAEQWAKKSVELNENSYNLDTYACLLNKNGKNAEAISTQKKAILSAKKEGNDTEGLVKTLKEFEKPQN